MIMTIEKNYNETTCTCEECGAKITSDILDYIDECLCHMCWESKY